MSETSDASTGFRCPYCNAWGSSPDGHGVCKHIAERPLKMARKLDVIDTKLDLIACLLFACAIGVTYLLFR